MLGLHFAAPLPAPGARGSKRKRRASCCGRFPGYVEVGAYFLWLCRCSRTQLFRSSPVLPLHASRIWSRRATASLSRASHLAGSLLEAHISWLMQSRLSSPFLPSQALFALSRAALSLAMRSSQALGSFAFEQSTRRSPFGFGASEGAWATTGVKNANIRGGRRVLSMGGPFGRVVKGPRAGQGARGGARPTTRYPGPALTRGRTLFFSWPASASCRRRKPRTFRALPRSAASPPRCRPASRSGSDRKERRVGKECRSRWSPYH